VAVAPFAIDDGVAIRVTEGPEVSMVVDPPPPPQDARPDTANNTVKITLMRPLVRCLESSVLLLDMIVPLQLHLKKLSDGDWVVRCILEVNALAATLGNSVFLAMTLNGAKI